MACDPPFARGTGGWCGCNCKCCPPPSCSPITYEFWANPCANSGSSDAKTFAPVAEVVRQFNLTPVAEGEVVKPKRTSTLLRLWRTPRN